GMREHYVRAAVVGTYLPYRGCTACGVGWCVCSRFFFFTDPAPTEIYTLSLHDALPISRTARTRDRPGVGRPPGPRARDARGPRSDRKSTRLNSSHDQISYAVFCLKKKKKTPHPTPAIRIVQYHLPQHPPIRFVLRLHVI